VMLKIIGWLSDGPMPKHDDLGKALRCYIQCQSYRARIMLDDETQRQRFLAGYARTPSVGMPLVFICTQDV